MQSTLAKRRIPVLGQRRTSSSRLSPMTGLIWIDRHHRLNIAMGRLFWQGSLKRLIERITLAELADSQETIKGDGLSVRRASTGLFYRRQGLMLVAGPGAIRPGSRAYCSAKKLNDILNDLAEAEK